MAAYGALVSLKHIIDHIQNHPRPPISLNREQVESLTKKITFLQAFLEAYNSHGGNKELGDLRRRIAGAAYAAEDIIEAHVVCQILAQPTSTNDGQNITSVDLYQDLQQVIQNMDSLEKDATEIKDKIGIQDQLQRNSTPVVSSRSPSTGQNIMVGFDDVFKDVMEKLIGHQSKRQIIPIVGMGGIGKTTLARHLYENKITVDHFDVRAWVTVSQEYNAKEILSKILSQVSKGSSSGSSEEELKEKLHKSLFGRRYLVVLDDIWVNEAWEKVKFYLQDNNCGSRIIVTTRISDVAMHLTGTSGLQMNFLDDERSWELLHAIVFGKNSCPLQLEEIGKKIAKLCKGLPLSITVIGGLLAKSDGELKLWEYVSKNLNSVVNLEDDERCLKILHTSFDFLPVHLKPCFLYMGTFPEDSEIRVSQLIKLWIAEGFLKPNSDKSLEVVAEEYLKDLIDRNLILVRQWGSLSEKIRSCNLHDVLRELCFIEAQKDKFLCVTVQNSLKFSEGVNTQHHIANPERILMKVEKFGEVYHTLQLTSSIRSLICDFHKVLPSLNLGLSSSEQKAIERCLYDGEERYSLDAIFQLVNLRRIPIADGWNDRMTTISFPHSISLIWNLQTLIVKDSKDKVVAPPEIWEMPQLRHVEFYKLCLPDPPSGHMGKQDDFVLGNLHTLLGIVNFKLGENVVKRIPNVKKLQISYEEFVEGFEVASYYCLNNLHCLQKLECIACSFHDEPCQSDLCNNLTFPGSLRKLTLYGSELKWEAMSTIIGSLRHLEVLKLKRGSCVGRKWSVENQFNSLRVLSIEQCGNLRHWMVESAFPRLECLVLRGLVNLKEIPECIGETLKSIRLDDCSNSAIVSAKQMLEKQEESGNEDFNVTVLSEKLNHQLQSMASHNFQVRLLFED